MKEDLAKEIANILKNGVRGKVQSRKIKDSEIPKGPESWHKGLPNLGYYRVSHLRRDRTFSFLVSQWRKKWGNNEWYILAFPKVVSNNSLYELCKTSSTKPKRVSKNMRRAQNETRDNRTLLWEYNPRKKDGKNKERKGRFRKLFGNPIKIPVPEKKADYFDFLETLFDLVDKRIEADNLPSPLKMREGFPEGREVEQRHLHRERNATLLKVAKERHSFNNPNMECQVCGFSFFEKYGKLGKKFIEGHHTVPLKEGARKTEIKDIALVCSNCHRMIHRKRPWLTIRDLKKILRRK